MLDTVVPKTKVLVIVGPTCSGKTTLARKLESEGLRRIVSWTTRPPRKGEVDGVDYNFITEAEFKSREAEYFFAEVQNYGEESWRYGTACEDYDPVEPSVVVLDTYGASRLYGTKGVFVYWLDAPEIERLIILKRRGDNEEEAKRRVEADRKLFDSYRKSGRYDIRVVRHMVKGVVR